MDGRAKFGLVVMVMDKHGSDKQHTELFTSFTFKCSLSSPARQLLTFCQSPRLKITVR